MTHCAVNGRGSVERDRSNIIVTLLMFLALSATSSGVRGADGDLLTVIGSGDELRSYSTQELKVNITSEFIRFMNPYYEKEKSFEAFRLSSLLKTFFPSASRNPEKWEIQIDAMDGYRSVAELAKLLEDGGYLVFRDVDDPMWEEMRTRRVSPGPFAIVWVGADQLFEDGYPWPWQIKTILLKPKKP